MSATDILLAQIPGAEIRLAGDHIEHCTICRDCKGAGRFLSEAVWRGNRFYPRRYEACEPCDGTGYASRTVCVEGDCAACDRAEALLTVRTAYVECGCGRRYQPDAFAGLKQLGVQKGGGWTGRDLLLANCACGSTISMEAEP